MPNLEEWQRQAAAMQANSVIEAIKYGWMPDQIAQAAAQLIATLGGEYIQFTDPGTAALYLHALMVRNEMTAPRG